METQQEPEESVIGRWGRLLAASLFAAAGSFGAAAIRGLFLGFTMLEMERIVNELEVK